MKKPKQLLPSIPIKAFFPFICLAVFIGLILLFDVMYTNHLNTNIERLQLKVDNLNVYRDALRADPNNRHYQLAFKDHLIDDSHVSLQIISLLHTFPSLKLIYLNKTSSKKNSKKKGKNKNSAALPDAAEYIKSIDPNPVLLKPYFLGVSGSYDKLVYFIKRLSILKTPLIIQKVSLDGSNYPHDTLHLTLAFFTQEK